MLLVTLINLTSNRLGSRANVLFTVLKVNPNFWHTTSVFTLADRYCFHLGGSIGERTSACEGD